MFKIYKMTRLTCKRESLFPRCCSVSTPAYRTISAVKLMKDQSDSSLGGLKPGIIVTRSNPYQLQSLTLGSLRFSQTCTSQRSIAQDSDKASRLSLNRSCSSIAKFLSGRKAIEPLLTTVLSLSLEIKTLASSLWLSL